MKTVLKYGSAKGYKIHFVMNTTSQTFPGKWYRVDMRTINPVTQKNWKYIATGNIPMMVNCSCPDFKYRWETVLWKANVSRRQQSNGQMPNITNPRYKKSLCKHSLNAWGTVRKYVLSKKDIDKLGQVRRGFKGTNAKKKARDREQKFLMQKWRNM